MVNYGLYPYVIRLPAEVALNVFKWLPKCSLAKCARVCKRWNRLTQDESLWRRLDRGLTTVPAGVIGQVKNRESTSGIMVSNKIKFSGSFPRLQHPQIGKINSFSTNF